MAPQPIAGCFGSLHTRVLRAVADLSEVELAELAVELATFLAERRDRRTLCVCCGLPYTVADFPAPSTRTVQ